MLRLIALLALLGTVSAWSLLHSSRCPQLMRPSMFSEPESIRPDIARVMALLLKDETARFMESRTIVEHEDGLGADDDYGDDVALLEAEPVSLVDSPVDSLSGLRSKGGVSHKTVAAADEDEDPLLGQLLVDLGDKRIYLCDVPKLLRLPVWEKQRSYRQERAKGIALDKLRKKQPGASISFPGVISLYEKAWEEEADKEDQGVQQQQQQQQLPGGDGNAQRRRKFGIVDGQHRVGALRVLFGKGEFDSRVLIEVFPLTSEEAVSELFSDINKAEPVKDVDLPGMASDFERETLSRVADTLRAAYPEMFKDSIKCRKPHLHVDNLRDALFSHGVVGRHGHKDEAQLLEWIFTENYKLEERSDDEWMKLGSPDGGRKKAPGAAFVKALDKARSFRFFLGLDDNWLDN